MNAPRSGSACRRSSRKGVAALSAITLALSGLSITSFNTVVPEATAATLSGGIRDKSGAVEKDAQKASDLLAGSCTVSESTTEGSQAGFSWYTSEPSASSPNKKAWGLSVSFDNSKDRTFADWSFTNAGLMGAYLDTAQIPAMDAGQTLVDKVVTHKADEALVIDGSRQQRNLNLNAELTDAKVKQFAEATAANPVRYAWQGKYKADRTSSPFATQGDSASFTAVVNPWPSENIECNPITVSWEDFEKHVIVPGEETKVGKINIPDVTGDGTDDSMSRMVVEAYDGNGKFIGTTDPAASGGTQNLRIDETTGDIYFTWPEYRGTDLATDKNVNFSVLAKPRSVDELKDAAKSNNEFIEHDGAFDSSNSLTRYNKANVIDSKAFSLDDTEYHSPKYDKTDASIISGVDSATGPLATEPQKVTFTQTPDLIKELAKKKGDGGFEAKVELDEKYVYEGWTVDIDDDYNVTVTAPENPKPGSFARPKITVEYSNGSTDELELLVVVDPNNTQVTDLVRPSLAKGKLNEDITAQVGTKSIMKGHKPVHPAKFEIDQSTVPEGWTVTVDDTGKVTAKADDSVAPGTVITPKVKATYPDQTTDEIETQFQAIVDIKIPTYDTVTGQPNASVSLTPEIPERGLSGNTTDEPPTRYTFEDGTNQTTLTSKDGKTWTVYVDEKTGEISTTIPKGAQEGDILNVPVQAHYSDEGKQKPQTVVGTVVVIKGDIKANYNVQTTAPGQEVKHQVEDTPDGSTFSFGRKDGKPVLSQEVNGWKYTIDPNTGEVSSIPPADAKPGDKNTVTVTVNAPGGLTTQAPVTTVVKLTNSWESEPVVPSQTVYPGGTATSPIGVEKPAEINLAADKPFTIDPNGKGLEATGENNEFGNPTYKMKTANGDWIVGLDDKGNVISTAPETAKPGDKIDVPVIVTYEDGSKDNTTATVNVIDVPKRELPFQVEYKYDDTVPAGTYKVETKGEPGSEKMNLDGTWERTKEPVNEVVVVGTKPAESAKDVEWTFPIPYPTEVRENPELKPGEMKVIQEGANGERKYSAKFTSKGDQASVAEEKVTKEPQTRIIEVGPGIPDQELTSKKTQEVPFEIEYVYDDTLESGKQVVDEEGVPGEQTITSTQKIKDGKPDGEPSINIEQTKAPKKAKIRIGTKTTGENTETYKAEAPYKVVVKYDPNMPAGESKVTTKGEPGEKTVTIKRDIVNSKPGDPQITEEIIKEPVDEVITVGTKPSEASSKVEWKAQIPFEVETRPNPELKPGEIKVVQEGVPGEKTYTADFSAKGDQATVTPEEKQTKDPVNQIIEYGPAAEDTSVVTKTEKPVPFETEIVFDDSLKAGEQVVDKQGENGTEVVTSKQKIVDGKPSGEPTVTTERTKEPTNAVIRVGTKTEGKNTTESEVEVPFETEIQFDDSLPAGTQETVQEGKPGKDKVTTTQTIENSKVTGTTTETERVEEPVKKIIKVGTKGDTTSKTVEWTESTPFEVEVRENPALKAGETKVVQEGKPGEVKHTVTVTSDNGEISTKDDTEEVSKPTKQIIEVGTAPSQTELSDKHTEQLPFETLIESDPNLEAGKIVEDQAGSFGEKEVTKVWKLKDGKVVGDPETTEDVTKEPTPRKLRVGTKVVTETQTETETEKVTETKEVPVELDRGFYGVELTKPGEPASQNIKDGSEGNTYEIGELPAGWTATVDENGTVTATPPADAKSGDYAEIPVTVTPEGGKPYTATATFIVKDDQPVEPTQPTYNPAVIEAGDTQTVDINYGHTDGNTYELGEVPAGWTVTIDETTGQLTVTPPADTPSGTIQEIPVTVITEDGQTFNVKTVIGVISDNCGCDPVEPTDPTDEPTDDPTEDPKDPTDKPTTDPTEDPKDPTGEPTTDPTDEPTGKPTVDPSEDPSEDPKDPTEDPKDPTGEPTTDPTDEPTDPAEDPTDEPTDKPEPNDPKDPKDPEDPRGSSIPDGLVPIIGGLIGGGILGSSVNDHHTPGGSPDAKPKVPTAPQPKPGEDEPKISGKVELNKQGQQTNGQTNQSNPSYGDAPRSNSTTSSQSGSKSTSGSTSSNRALADTGANVLGIVGVGIALIIGSTLLLRRERRND